MNKVYKYIGYIIESESEEETKFFLSLIFVYLVMPVLLMIALCLGDFITNYRPWG